MGRVLVSLVTLVAALAATGCASDHRDVGAPLVIDRPEPPPVPFEETEGFARSNQPCPPGMHTDPITPLAGPSPVRLLRVVDLPGASVLAFDTTGAAFVGTRDGAVFAWDGSTLSAEPVLDLRADTQVENDAGLLGMAVHDDRLYVYRNDAAGDSLLTSYPLHDGLPVASRGAEMLLARQPTNQHNGGSVTFDPSGNLYLTLGDGGGPGDPFQTAQDIDSPFGAVLRMRPAPGGTPAVQPAADNPYIGSAPGHDLVWAKGVRNAFRFWADPVTGQLWLGDVGQWCAEEINVVPTVGEGGTNLGWSVFEGTGPFLGHLAVGTAHREPFFSYSHAEGRCAVIAGEVYRGDRIPGLAGQFVFADFCSGELVALDPATAQAQVVHVGDGIVPVELVGSGDGELHVVDLASGVWRVVPAGP